MHTDALSETSMRPNPGGASRACLFQTRNGRSVNPVGSHNCAMHTTGQSKLEQEHRNDGRYVADQDRHVAQIAPMVINLAKVSARVRKCEGTAIRPHR